MAPNFSCSIFACIIISICCCFIIGSHSQEDFESSNSMLNLAKILLPTESISANLTASEKSNVLILIPSGVNISDLQANENNFNLFKLNTEVLFNNNNNNQVPSQSSYARSDDRPIIDELTVSERNIDTGDDDYQDNHHKVVAIHPEVFVSREGRKMNFLRGVWNKPKSSPLYLVNGTVCRFVNSAPICTTLSTTGLLRKFLLKFDSKLF